MAYQTLPASPLPDNDPDMTEEPKLIETKFQGYSQRVPMGINNVQAQLTLSWTNIRSTDYATLLTFSNDHMPQGKPFLWTVPGEGTARKWKITRRRRKIRGVSFYSISFDIEQVFDP